jgi:uncharacterized protein involved in exopolysaccharide biosynthesis
MKIKVQTIDPVLSYQISLAIIKVLQSINQSDKFNSVIKNKKIIKENFKHYQDKLFSSEKRLLAFLQRNKTAVSPILNQQKRRLMRNVNLYEGLTIEMKKQLELTTIEERKTNQALRIINYPNIAVYKDSPNKKKYAILGFIIGAILSTILALLKTWWDVYGKELLNDN